MATREQTYSPPDSRELAFTRALNRAYTLNWEAIAYTVILLLALITRFVDLGARVMSHDESLHTYYSWRLAEFGEFQHTPLMHGPLLFHMTALNYWLFGATDFTSRIYPAFLGVLIVMFPLLFRRWLGRIGAVIASALLLISPMLLYYSRYIRHDIPTIFFALVLLYATLQYIDGVHPRRPVWLVVLAAALLGMLASKEVSFIYIAIFGSFLTLFWLMRMMQDIGVRRRPVNNGGWQTPPIQLALGHAILLAAVGGLALSLGAFIRYAFSPVVWIPSALWVQVPLFLVIYVPLAGLGVIRRALSGGARRAGTAAAIMRGFSNERSALYVLLAGVIIGSLLALLIIGILDVIKPDTVWRTTVVMSQNDQTYGVNATKEYATGVDFDQTMFVRLLTWVGLPVLVLAFAVFLSAVFKFPGTMPLPWREILLIVLIALITTSVLVMFERRSFVSEASSQPFAVDPNATSASDGGQYDNTPIIVAWVIGTVAVLAVLGMRFLTNWWDFFNRQPTFDILIMVGTLILPWLAAFPLYWAGYNLEEYNPNSLQGRETLNAAVAAFIPFALVAASVGLSWNWKRWLPAAAVFIGLFAFFFTTVFSNQYGMATGMIGSLGYWLEQQGVRRGSQPQYYYLLVQMPVYEFLPMIGALCAGALGLSRLWGWRRDRLEAAQLEAEFGLDYDDDDEDDEIVTLDDAAAHESETVIAGANRTQAINVAPLEPLDQPGGDEHGDLPATDAPVSVVRYAGAPSRLFRPFSLDEEREHRAEDPEWIGRLPFLGLVGYWAIMIFLGLTVAGEKMPWLSTHLTLPLILLTGWWLGQVIGGIKRATLRGGGWLVLFVALPLAFVALAQVILPVWGDNPPFQGRTPEQLATTGNWLAAFLILLGVLYVVGRIGRRMGLYQLGRMALLSGMLILAVLTARTAFMASYVNYDYATEYLVYAHAGPAVKTVMSEVDRIAEITNEGSNMRVVFDDESSWPFTWYFRNYPNYGFMRGEAGSVDPATLEGAKIVVVGSKKAGDVRRILGDRFYEFSYIRLWWPMQEYFNLTYDRVANVFSTNPDNVAAKYYREGLFDIWWNRDYSTYGQAMCIEDKQPRCEAEAAQGDTPEDQQRNRESCQRAVVSECKSDKRFAVSNWPVSDRMYFFVDKQIAAEVWDAGIGSATVNIREPEYPEDRVYQDVNADAILGQSLGLSGPRGIAIDANGLLYVTDTDNNRIVVMDQNGIQVGVIGSMPGGTSDPGSLRQPWGVDIGPDGNVYVADTWNHRVQVFSPSGELLRAWGHEGVPATDPSTDAFWGPRDIKVGPDGNVYVADTGNKRIRVYTPEGDFVRDIGSPGTGLGQLDEPVGLAFNPVSGNLYVAEAWNKRIQVFDRTGMPIRTFDVNMWFQNRESFNRPFMTFNPDGTLLYVTDMDDRTRIVAYDLNGQPVISFNQPDNLETGVLGLRSPAGLATDAGGRVYVADAELSEIFVFPPPGVTGSVLPVPPLDLESSAPTDAGSLITEEATGPVTDATEIAPDTATDTATEESTGLSEG